ncbi:hypothetical protein [Silvanigrella aquatica]|uniref:Uncharacterized protein n=1 Tax=Silvanigrella aquatica TaxID=1915309 RepID=A0A1L4D2J9_9BACT|nr:hypothetical protein [Silvanigrella aquatica]APJ04417.1 hypothetical protein AXG55_11065 [Silvanigrella aquatica]
MIPLIFFSAFISLKSSAAESLIENNSSTIFSPYDDITVGAVWTDWQNYPDGRPADVIPIAEQTGTKEFVMAFIQSIYVVRSTR